MKIPDLDSEALCPRCASILERLPDGAWFCQKCVYGWTKEELAQNPDDLPQKSFYFTIKTGNFQRNVSEWDFKRVALNAVSEVTNTLQGLKPCRRREAQTRFEVTGDLKGALQPL